MPIFEFKCNECGAVQECLVNSGEEQTKLSCLKCGSPSLTKLMSCFAISRGTQPKPTQPNVNEQSHCAMCGGQVGSNDAESKYVPALKIKIDSESGTACCQEAVVEIVHTGRTQKINPVNLN